MFRPVLPILFFSVLLSWPTFAQEPKPDQLPKATGRAILFPNGRGVVVSIGQVSKQYLLIGVEPIDSRACRATLRELLNNQAVRLEFDPGSPAPSFGIPGPAYIYRSSDNLFINRELIARGLARVDGSKPFLKSPELLAAQEAAFAAHGDDPVKLIPDPNYTPRPGDRVILYDWEGKDLDRWVAADYLAYEDLTKAVIADDRIGIEGLMNAGRVDAVPTGTPVLVIKFHDNPLMGNGIKPCEVRILGGRSRDKAVWVMAVDVVRLIRPAPVPKPGLSR